MKNIRIILSVTVAALSVLLASCEKEHTYAPGDKASGPQIYFSKYNKTSISLEEGEEIDGKTGQTTFALWICAARPEKSADTTPEKQNAAAVENVTVPITANAPEGFTVPASVEFPATADSVRLVVSVDQSIYKPGEIKNISFKIGDGYTTPYGYDEWEMRVKIYLEELWEPISTKAVFYDGIILPLYNYYQGYYVYVERLVKDKTLQGDARYYDIYRIVNPYTVYTDANNTTYTYPLYNKTSDMTIVDPGATEYIFLSFDDEYLYVETNSDPREYGLLSVEESDKFREYFGEGNKKGYVYMPEFHTNCSVSGLGVISAVNPVLNLSTNEGLIRPGGAYKIATYSKSNKIIKFNSMCWYFTEFQGGGWFPDFNTDPTLLYLDETIVNFDLTRVYDFDTQAFDAEGTAGKFVSESAGESWEQQLMAGTPKTNEDGSYDEGMYNELETNYGKPYSLPSLYADKTNIFFCVQGNKIAIPREYRYQSTGLKAYNQDTYFKINADRSSFETKASDPSYCVVRLSGDIVVLITDKDDNQSETVLGSYTETWYSNSAKPAEPEPDPEPDPAAAPLFQRAAKAPAVSRLHL